MSSQTIVRRESWYISEPFFCDPSEVPGTSMNGFDDPSAPIRLIGLVWKMDQAVRMPLFFRRLYLNDPRGWVGFCPQSCSSWLQLGIRLPRLLCKPLLEVGDGDERNLTALQGIERLLRRLFRIGRSLTGRPRRSIWNVEIAKHGPERRSPDG